MNSTFILPLTAKAIPEIIDYMFDNHNQYIGFSVKPGFNANFTAIQVSKFYHIKIEPYDVVKTWEQMIADKQLIEDGYYYPDPLYSINKDMI